MNSTRLESDEEIREALAKYRAIARSAGRENAGQGIVGHGVGGGDTPLFHPTQRPATPILTVMDDGEFTGEQVRIRRERFVIGRKQGHLVVAHDSQISTRHAELRRVAGKGGQRWYLFDLKSRNGTFVRVRYAHLTHGQEFVLGRTRLRFECPGSDAPDTPIDGDAQTKEWVSQGQPSTPSLTVVAPNNPQMRVLITRPEFSLGRDSNQCHLPLSDDPFVDPLHARLVQDAKRRWRLENNHSVNGVWLRISRLRMTHCCRFQLGEQQFQFHLPQFS